MTSAEYAEVLRAAITIRQELPTLLPADAEALGAALDVHIIRAEAAPEEKRSTVCRRDLRPAAPSGADPGYGSASSRPSRHRSRGGRGRLGAVTRCSPVRRGTASRMPGRRRGGIEHYVPRPAATSTRWVFVRRPTIRPYCQNPTPPQASPENDVRYVRLRRIDRNRRPRPPLPAHFLRAQPGVRRALRRRCARRDWAGSAPRPPRGRSWPGPPQLLAVVASSPSSGWWPRSYRARSAQSRKRTRATGAVRCGRCGVTGEERHRRRLTELLDQGRAAEVYAQYPLSRNEVKATRLGNILRASERYPNERYGADAVLVWPRLYPLLPDSVVTGIAQARESLEFLLGCPPLRRPSACCPGSTCSWSRLRSGCSWCVSGGPWPSPLLAYRSSLGTGLLYAEVLRSAFDLYRLRRAHRDATACAGVLPPPSASAGRR